MPWAKITNSDLLFTGSGCSTAKKTLGAMKSYHHLCGVGLIGNGYFINFIMKNDLIFI